jgi:hypothetical protein
MTILFIASNLKKMAKPICIDLAIKKYIYLTLPGLLPPPFDG